MVLNLGPDVMGLPCTHAAYIMYCVFSALSYGRKFQTYVSEFSETNLYQRRLTNHVLAPWLLLASRGRSASHSLANCNLSPVVSALCP